MKGIYIKANDETEKRPLGTVNHASLVSTDLDPRSIAPTTIRQVASPLNA